MIILDANTLLYAYNSATPQHSRAVKWLEGLFESGEDIGLPWLTVWAFVRIATNPRIWPEPLSLADAFETVHQWLTAPGVIIPEPGPRHFDLLKGLVTNSGAGGPLVSDAALAAIAIANGAQLASTDQDFSRFSELRWYNPLI